MDKFGFIVHPIDVDQIHTYWPITRFLPETVIEVALVHIRPFIVSHIKSIRSITGKEIEGFLLGCPLLPKQILNLKEETVLSKIIETGRIGEKLGAKILGLGGYTSIVADKGVKVSNNLKMAVTSGNALTSWSVVEAIYQVANAKNMNLKNASLTVIGATGSIGSLCSKKMSKHVSSITITARHREKLEKLKQEIRETSTIDVIIKDDVHEAIKEADIIITTTSTPEALIDIKELKPNSIACDVSVPKNIANKINLRRDVTVINGGLIKLPYPTALGTYIGLPKDTVYACMAEAMLLTLEEKFVNFSLGDNINLEKLNEISNMANKHGFKVCIS